MPIVTSMKTMSGPEFEAWFTKHRVGNTVKSFETLSSEDRTKARKRLVSSVDLELYNKIFDAAHDTPEILFSGAASDPVREVVKSDLVKSKYEEIHKKQKAVLRLADIGEVTIKDLVNYFNKEIKSRVEEFGASTTLPRGADSMIYGAMYADAQRKWEGGSRKAATHKRVKRYDTEINKLIERVKIVPTDVPIIVKKKSDKGLHTHLHSIMRDALDLGGPVMAEGKEMNDFFKAWQGLTDHLRDILTKSKQTQLINILKRYAKAVHNTHDDPAYDIGYSDARSILSSYSF